MSREKQQKYKKVPNFVITFHVSLYKPGPDGTRLNLEPIRITLNCEM